MGVLYAKVAGSFEPILNSSTGGGGGTGGGDPGDIKATIAATAPAGWLMFGQTVATADTLYPALWAVAPAAWKSGTDLVLPATTDATLLGGGTLGTVGGANARTLVEANLPPHDHAMAHTHVGAAHTHSIGHNHATATTSSTGSHQHVMSFNLQTNTAVGGTQQRFGGAGSADYNTAAAGAHSHTVDLATFSGNSGGASATTTGGSSATNTGNAGSGTAVDTTPKHLRVNWVIKT